ncbi:hypothetical protein [Thaumasiovibrio subtropicus]|uniref:hypothetical protein n=1 Tax=Thaumasiovibrio subtropicus TaxID=1891207 RepID=UPI000B3563AB|nr:hypothetical protein [Thaumasiovibrio subtropicus]
MKRFWVLSICLLLITGCLSKQLPIHSSSIGGLSAHEVPNQTQTTVRITGIVMDSGFVLVEHEVTQEADALIIKAQISDGVDGRPSFEIDVAVPEGVSSVRFGLDKREIWTR